jgi:hypothetical protein
MSRPCCGGLGYSLGVDRFLISQAHALSTCSGRCFNCLTVHPSPPSSAGRWPLARSSLTKENTGS